MLAPIRVAMADDHPIVLSGIQAQLSQHGMAVAYTAHHFSDLLAALEAEQSPPIDVLVLDLSRMGEGPITMVTRLHARFPDLAIVVFSSLVDIAPEIIAAGALGYVAKEDMVEHLPLAIRHARRGAPYHSPQIARYLAEANNRHNKFSSRELSVLKLLVQGMSTSEVAADLKIDPRTVQNHITHMLEKTGLPSRTHLVTWYASGRGELGR